MRDNRIESRLTYFGRMKHASSNPRDSAVRAARLVAERAEWLAFLRRRVASDADAEDLLQVALLKAFHHADEIRVDENLTAWFYRLLRHALADHYRKNAAEHRRIARLHADMQASGTDHVHPAADEMLALCGCLLPRLRSLKPRYAELIWAVDFEEHSPSDVAKTKRVSVNALSVTLHRARKALRRELERFCGECAEAACLDCGCPPLDRKGKV